MGTLKLTLALFLLTFTLQAQLNIGNPFFVGGVLKYSDSGGSNPPASPLVNQNFEGAGYDNSETWTEGGFGTKDEDYTGTVLLGSQSLEINIPGSSLGYTYVGYTSGGERWGYCMVRASSVRDATFIAFQNAGGVDQMAVGVQGTNLRVTCGSGTPDDTVDTFSTGTTYHLWWHYVKGTGADAVAELWFSTNGTKPADGSNGHAKLTDGTSTADVQYLVIYASNSAGSDFISIFDHVYVDDEAILSNP